jgi:predicted nucleic-acid-binding Zn-ribbon protein
MTSSYYDDEETCLHCGHNEFEFNWDMTAYVCLKCHKPQLELQEIEKTPKSKLKKFRKSKHD